jgi:cyclin C
MRPSCDVGHRLTRHCIAEPFTLHHCTTPPVHFSLASQVVQDGNPDQKKSSFLSSSLQWPLQSGRYDLLGRYHNAGTAFKARNKGGSRLTSISASPEFYTYYEAQHTENWGLSRLKPTMAANYWSSTQRQHWSFTREKLADLRDELDEQNATVIIQYPIPDRRLFFIFLKDRILQLVKRLPFRQQCVATAMVYMQRYYLSNAIQNVNPYLLVATAFYLASKTEESPHHIRLVASEARQAWPEYIPTDVAKIGEMEFSLISEMQSQLIVWHPYRTLLSLKGNPELGLAGEEIASAWSIINDTFMTDMPLVCPPHLIAAVAIFLGIVFQPNKASLGLASLPQSNVSANDMGFFSSLGGRPGAAGPLGGPPGNPAVGQMTPTSHPVPQANGAGQSSNAAIRAKITTLAQASEKIQRILTFLVESEIDLDDLIEAVQELISLYEVWEQYNEKTMKETISRYMKARGLDGL